MRNTLILLALILGCFTVLQSQNIARLPQNMEFTKVLRVDSKTLLLVSHSDCYNYRKHYNPTRLGNESDSSASSIYLYEPDNGKFKKVAQLKECRNFFGVCLVDNKLYMLGGYNSKWHASKEFEEFDITTGTFRKLASPKYERAMMACEAVGNKIYVFNGIGKADKYEVYDINTNKWNVFDPIRKGTEVSAIDSVAGSAVVDASIYFLSADGHKLLEYLSSTNTLTQKASPSFSKNDFCMTLSNKKLYVADGLCHGKPDTRMYVYMVLTDKWEPAGSNPFARTREALIWHNGSLFIIGGSQLAPDGSLNTTDEVSLSRPMK